MTHKGFILVVISALLTVMANLMLRAGVVKAGGFSLSTETLAREVASLLRQPLFDMGMFLYGLASLVWFRVISTEELSRSYPLLVSLTFLLVTLGAVLLFRESLSIRKLIGLGVILAGILLVART